MYYSNPWEIRESDWNGSYPEAPTSTEIQYPNLTIRDLLVSLYSAYPSEPVSYRSISWSVRGSFFLGAILVGGMLVAFWQFGAWIGLMFIPPIMGAYGLFLSNGKQLNDLDARSMTEISLSATPSNFDFTHVEKD